MTSVLMIFEMTRDYAVIVPLMISEFDEFLHLVPISEAAHLRCFGRSGWNSFAPAITLKTNSANAQSLRSCGTLRRYSPREMSVEDAVKQTRSDHFRIWPVADKGSFLGILNREDMECALVDGRKEQPLTSLVDTVHIPHAHKDQPLHLALEHMSMYRLDVLPVVHRADLRKLEGVVTLSDVLDAYGIERVGPE